MKAYQNIQTLNAYGVTRIVTTCPHCFNVLKNEYPVLGGRYEVVHHVELLQQLIDEGRIRLKENGPFHGKGLLITIPVTWGVPMASTRRPERYFRRWT